MKDERFGFQGFKNLKWTPKDRLPLKEDVNDAGGDVVWCAC